ncbi:hypothetical protein [Stenotrophomonas maltophilia]|uniref:hypothetical protein n=1 Tax=Stenotrophomonas maltophilia TaxID=40324 RepID=UPI0013D91764|nr:hypothetical protein [Stenotrophomonas maltophilia]
MANSTPGNANGAEISELAQKLYGLQEAIDSLVASGQAQGIQRERYDAAKKLITDKLTEFSCTYETLTTPKAIQLWVFNSREPVSRNPSEIAHWKQFYVNELR